MEVVRETDYDKKGNEVLRELLRHSAKLEVGGARQTVLLYPKRSVIQGQGRDEVRAAEMASRARLKAS